MKKNSIMLKLTGFFLSVLLIGLTLTEVLLLGIDSGLLNENVIYENMEESDLYEDLYEDIFGEFEVNSSTEMEMLREAIPKEKIAEVYNSFIHYLFTLDVPEFDFTDEIDGFVSTYGNYIKNSYTTYVEDFFDELEDRNYNYSKPITLNTEEETFCINLGIDLNTTISELWISVGESPEYLEMAAPDIESEFLTTAIDEINAELETLKTLLYTEINFSAITEELASETVLDTLRPIHFISQNIFISELIFLLMIVALFALMYVIYPEKYRAIRNFALSLLLCGIITGVFTGFATMVVTYAQTEIFDIFNGNGFVYYLILDYIQPFWNICGSLIIISLIGCVLSTYVRRHTMY